MFCALPSKLWIPKQQIDSQLSVNSFMISVLKSIFYYFQKSHHIFIQFKNHSPDLAKEYSKNLISEFLVYIHSADRHRYSINIY